MEDPWKLLQRTLGEDKVVVVVATAAAVGVAVEIEVVVGAAA